MQSTTQRVYTPHSLEFWFEKLEHDWSGAFSAIQLEKGREIYVGGEVRELELTERDAIVHRRVEKKDEYAVIEWTAEGISVRSSSTDREFAHALAVAGLHEIEELVADEISLPRIPNNSAPRKTSAPARRVQSARLPEPAKRPGPRHRDRGRYRQSQPSRGSSRSARTLLIFRPNRRLTFTPWLEADGKTDAPPGPEAHGNGNGHVPPPNAKAHRLAAYGRKAHFHYNQGTGVYIMESLVETEFLRRSC